MQAEDIEFATEWAKKALRLMADRNITPSPDNYAVWFRYASGQTPELTQEIDRRIAQNQPLDANVTASLQEKFLAEGQLTNVTLNAGTRLNSEVDQILKIIGETVGNSSALGASVREASDGLTSQSTPHDVRLAVEAIVTASRKLEERSTELEDHLQASKKELGELQENLEKAHSEARTDGLTGINNRKAFDEILAREIMSAHANGIPLCLAIGDIDHFKKFNDTFGHRTGDQVLRLVANCLNTGALEQHIAARYGGEEFAVIMPATGIEAAETVSNNIRETVQARELVKRSSGESLGRVTMSIGIAILRPGETPSSLIERADGHLYDAKHNGRNRVVSEAAAAAAMRAQAS